MAGEIRIGKVSSINYKNGMVRVAYQDKDGAVTAELPMLNNGREYYMPSVGDSVLVAHLSNGASRGVAIGTYWNKKNSPPAAGEGVYHKRLSKNGEADIGYDAAGKATVLRSPEIVLEDASFRISLSALCSRLEALDGDRSARKE